MSSNTCAFNLFVAKEKRSDKIFDLQIICVFAGEGRSVLNGLFDPDLLASLVSQVKADKFTGKTGEILVQFSANKTTAKRVMLVGLGSKAELNPDSLRKSFTAAFLEGNELKCASACLTLPDLSGTGVSVHAFGSIVAEIVGRTGYQRYTAKTAKGGHKKPVRLAELSVLCNDDHDSSGNGELAEGLKHGQTLASSINLARDLVNMPACLCTPQALAEEAEKIARESDGLAHCRVLGKKELSKLRANLLLAVNKGSAQEPVLIELSYMPDDSKSQSILALVGKSVTFDSGGLDIKSADGMRTMKADMAGGAAVLGAFRAIVAMKLPIRVRAYLAATENMTGPAAYKPGDVITSLSGLTVEVDNTDAEGRLTLADAIAYAKRQGASQIIDVATLTGAQRIMTGIVGAGCYSNNEALKAVILAAAAATGERLMDVPMWEELREANKTPEADLKNSGGSAWGAGAVTAAWFIREFAGKTPWVHMDIAGVAYRDRALGADPAGGTGYAVRTLVEAARQLCQ